MVAEDGGQAADPRARQSRSRDHAGGGRARCAPTPSSPPAARDYPNQVNNVLCFPFIFRGALDVGATTINEEMKIACVEALADLARAEPSDVVAAAYGDDVARLRPRLPHPQAVRSAPDPRARAGGGQGGDGLRRGDAADRRFRRLSRAARPVRLPLRPGHAAGVRAARAAIPSAWSMPRARTSACCAPCRQCSTSASRSRS